MNPSLIKTGLCPAHASGAVEHEFERQVFGLMFGNPLAIQRCWRCGLVQVVMTSLEGEVLHVLGSSEGELPRTGGGA